jgi:hypothetical protein
MPSPVDAGHGVLGGVVVVVDQQHGQVAQLKLD